MDRASAWQWTEAWRRWWDGPDWQRTLVVLWVGEFLIAAGTNLVIPFLPLYIEQLGIHRLVDVERWSGVVFSSTFFLSALAQPIWGKLADRVGRKPMLIRSGLGMGLIMASLGLVHNVWQLLILRALMGTVSGFIGAAIALQASQTPRQEAGRALGTLQTGAVSGTLVGPLIGGVLSEWVGIRHCFFITGAAEVGAAVLVIFFVHERFAPDPKVAEMGLGAFVQELRRRKIVLPLFAVTLLIQMGYLSIEPIVTVYVHLLNPRSQHLATLAGATFAAIGVGNVISAPRLGRLADRIGAERVLWWSLVAAACLYVPQAFVTSAYQLMGLRLALGLALGGLQPSVQALIRRHTPTALLGRVYGFNASSMMVGNLIGPNLGGFVSAAYGIPMVFFSTAAVLGLDAIWVYRAVVARASLSSS